MTDGYWFENVWIAPRVAESISAVQSAFDLLEAGEIAHLLPDPFFVRPGGKPPLSDADVDRIIAAIDSEYHAEMERSPGHHKNRSGATEHTDLWRLPPLARRALVEQLAIIMERHQSIDQSAPVGNAQTHPDCAG